MKTIGVLGGLGPQATGTPQLPFQAHPLLLDAATRLGNWVDFLVITSNTPHLVQEQIEQAAGCFTNTPMPLI